jgi:hypothetical protein
MKLTIYFFLVGLGLSGSAHAKSAQFSMRCIDRSYACTKKEGGTEQCSWEYGSQSLHFVDLKQAPSSPDYEHWTGAFKDTIRDSEVYLNIHYYPFYNQNSEFEWLPSILWIRKGDLSAESQANYPYNLNVTLRQGNSGTGFDCFDFDIVYHY